MQGEQGSLSPYCSGPSSLIVSSIHPAELPEMTGDCVAGSGCVCGSDGRFNLGLPKGAYPGVACLVGELGDCHVQSASACQVLITLVLCVAGQPMGRQAPERVLCTDGASESRGPCPVCPLPLLEQRFVLHTWASG